MSAVLPPLDPFSSPPSERSPARRRAARWTPALGIPSLVLGTGLLFFFVVVALAAVATFGPSLGTLSESFALANSDPPPGPSAAHPFGTMTVVGVDVLTALYQATPWDVGLVAGITLSSLAVGLFLGARAGAGGRASEVVVTTAGDLLASVPPAFLVVVLFLGLVRMIDPPEYLWVFGIAFIAILWPHHARAVRARALSVAQESYVEAARAQGASRWWVLRHHILPNSFGPVLAQTPVDVANIFFVLTAFPFLTCIGGGGGGSPFGLLSPLPSQQFPEWGWLAANGTCYGYSILASTDLWWMYVFPVATIVLFGAAITLTCDGLERFFFRWVGK